MDVGARPVRGRGTPGTRQPMIESRAPLRIEHARLIDGTGAPPLIDATLVVDAAGKVTYAGPAAGAPPSPTLVPIDAAGRTLLPGFFDCHVHLAYSSDRPLVVDRALGDPVTQNLETVRRMRLTLDAGVTTARDLGGTAAAFRVAVERGLVEGPRMFVAVGIIGHTGGHSDMLLPSGLDLGQGVSALADGIEEVRLATRRVLRAGADVVKLCATGGMASPHDDPDDEDLTEEEIRAVVDEARRHRGRPVAAHAQGLAGILNAIRGGVTSLEHGYGIDERACDLLGESGAFLVPTVSTAYGGLDRARMSEWHYQKKLRWVGRAKENIAAAIQRGVRIATGTDAAVTPHGANLMEVVHLVELGMTPMQAITSGTLESARLLGVGDELGSLEPGKLADLVLCDGDPLADIGVLGESGRIVLVAQQGVVRKNLLAGRAGSVWVGRRGSSVRVAADPAARPVPPKRDPAGESR